MLLVSLNVRKTGGSAGWTTYGTFLVVVLGLLIQHCVRWQAAAPDCGPLASGGESYAKEKNAGLRLHIVNQSGQVAKKADQKQYSEAAPGAKVDAMATRADFTAEPANHSAH